MFIDTGMVFFQCVFSWLCQIDEIIHFKLLLFHPSNKKFIFKGTCIQQVRGMNDYVFVFSLQPSWNGQDVQRRNEDRSKTCKKVSMARLW